MRHRQVLGQNAVGLHVDEDAAFVTPLAPAVDHVAAGHCRHIFRRAALHGDAVQMAAVLRRELGDEGRLPQRLEAVHLIDGGEAGIFGVDEDQPVVGIDRELMGVNVARRIGHARNIEALVVQRLLVGELPWSQHILQAPNLGDGGEMDVLRRCREPHGAHEVPLEHREPAVMQGPDQHELAGLVRGEREAQAIGGEEIDETARGRDGGLLLLGRRRGSRRWLRGDLSLLCSAPRLFVLSHARPSHRSLLPLSGQV
jgi:hypothetical protein